MTDNTELKRVASAAKNWGGEVGESRWYAAECFKRPYFSVQDAEFIASCDPGRVLALIAQIERDELALRAFSTVAEIAVAERDQLRAEVAGLRTGYEAYERVNAGLKAECEKMRLALIKSHDFIMNDAQTRHMCDETGQVSPLFPKRVGILAEILAAAAKGEQS